MCSGSKGKGFWVASCDCHLPPPTPDDDCPAYVGPPFDLLSGENVEYVGCPDGDFIIISNYRFFAAQKKGFYNVST